MFSHDLRRMGLLYVVLPLEGDVGKGVQFQVLRLQLTLQLLQSSLSSRSLCSAAAPFLCGFVLSCLGLVCAPLWKLINAGRILRVWLNIYKRRGFRDMAKGVSFKSLSEWGPRDRGKTKKTNNKKPPKKFKKIYLLLILQNRWIFFYLFFFFCHVASGTYPAQEKRNYKLFTWLHYWQWYFIVRKTWRTLHIGIAYFVCMSYGGWLTSFGGCIYLLNAGNGKSGSRAGRLMGQICIFLSGKTLQFNCFTVVLVF